MRKCELYLYLLFAFTSVAVAADDTHNQKVHPVAVLKAYGRFSAAIDGHTPADTIFKDIDKISTIRLVARTNEVPCIIGERFGVLFDIRGLPMAEGRESLKVVWRYPKMKSSEGRVSRFNEFSWPIAITNGVANNIYLDWGLENSFELVSGQWVIEVYCRDTKLLKQAFAVVGCAPKSIIRP